MSNYTLAVVAILKVLIHRTYVRVCFRLGLMHVVATNIIVWIRTLIKESLHEITESEEEAHRVAMKTAVRNYPGFLLLNMYRCDSSISKR